MHFEEPEGRPGCDWFGVNYYSRALISWRLSPTCNPGEVMTDMPYVIYPAGLSLALQGAGALGVPLYITETGIADAGDTRRALLIDAYMAEVEKAVKAGHDLRGIYYWTLMDNFEWNFGYHMKFGIYEWHPDGSQKRALRKSGLLLQHWFKRLPGSVAEILRGRRAPAAEPEAKAAGQFMGQALEAAAA